VVNANPHWTPLLAELATARRATRLHEGGDTRAWSATERLPQVQAARGGALETDPVPVVPAEFLRTPWTPEEALRDLLRARLAALGPVTADRLAHECGVDVTDIDAALLALQSEGYVMQGHFSGDEGTQEWCERHLLARIHRYTIGRLRREIEPVAPRDFVRFLQHWHHLVPESRVQGPDALPAVLAQLEGWEAPAGAWEGELLRARVGDYSIGWLDDLCLSGRLAWTRLGDPGGERSAGALRTTPIVLLPRTRLAAWTSLAGQGSAPPVLSSRARRVH
jgi:ATP-dependent Lhr-like helicase